MEMTDKIKNIIPYYWQTKTDISELKNYLENIMLEQNNNNWSEKQERSTSIGSTRQKIVEWIIYVCKKLVFKNETLFRCVDIFDNYLSKINEMDQKNLQLSAVICLNISCKFEEINCNYLNFLNKHLLDSSYNKKFLIEKEIEILKLLKFKISGQNIYHFNNILTQLTIDKITNLKSVKDAEKGFFLAQLIKYNDIILKNFITYKESLCCLSFGAALICFKSTLIYLSSIFGMTYPLLFRNIEEHIDSFVNLNKSYTICHDKLNESALKLTIYLTEQNILPNIQNEDTKLITEENLICPTNIASVPVSE